MPETLWLAAADTQREPSPLWRATTTGLFYMLVCSAYIVISTRFAAQLSGDAAQLARIETAKGVAFVVITGALFTAVDYARWRYIGRQRRQLHAQAIELQRNERTAVARLLSATLAHDVNNLLVVIAGLVEQLREHADSEVQETRSHIEEGVGRLTRLARRIASAAASDETTEPEVLRLDDEAQRVVDLTRAHPDVRRCAVDVVTEGAVQASVRPDLFEEALMNLIINAAQASEPRGHIEIHVRREGTEAVVEVHDDGPGLTDTQREHLFEPFFTTKAMGTGLGLLSVRALAGTSGATVSVDRSRLGGALFRLRFPLAA